LSVEKEINTALADPTMGGSCVEAFGVMGPSRSVIKTCEDGPCSRYVGPANGYPSPSR